MIIFQCIATDTADKIWLKRTTASMNRVTVVTSSALLVSGKMSLVLCSGSRDGQALQAAARSTTDAVNRGNVNR